MSVFKTTFSRALEVYPSDNAVIPNPALFVSSGANTEGSPFVLIDENADFLTQKVYTGDVVFNDTTKTSATVVTVDTSSQLTLNADIFGDSGYNYIIYGMSSQANIGQPGCILYIDGTGGKLSVVTIAGDAVEFQTIPTGTVIPLQVREIKNIEGTADSIIALW
jgi:hypothetical protein